MMTRPAIEAARLRLVQHYVSKLQQAVTVSSRGYENRAHWLNLIQQDWEQIKQWQGWAAAWKDTQTEAERAHLCATFPIVAAEILRVRQTSSEQYVWVSQALDAAQKLHDSATERALLYQLCSLSLTLERPDKAQQHAHQLLECAYTAQDTISQARALFTLGAAAFIQGKYDEAQASFSKSINLFEACATVQEGAVVWLGLGRVANVRGDYQQARSYYLRYLNASTTARNEQAVIEAHIALGGVHLALRDYPTAEEHAQRAVALASPLGKTRFLPPALFSLAHAQKWSGKYESACICYQEGIEAARAVLSAPSTIANGLYGLGQARYMQGDYHAALTHFEEGLAIAQEAKFLLRVCEFSADMVFVHIALGDLNSAYLHLKEAILSARTLDTPHFLAKALAAAIALWHYRGETEQAALWAGLLSRFTHLLHPSLFNVSLFKQLESQIGIERYHVIVRQSETLQLENAVSDILRLPLIH